MKDFKYIFKTHLFMVVRRILVRRIYLSVVFFRVRMQGIDTILEDGRCSHTILSLEYSRRYVPNHSDGTKPGLGRNRFR